MAKLTPWFRADVKPAYVGVYQRNYRRTEALGIVYSHWDGKRWGVFGHSATVADQMKGVSSSYQSFQWRGLTSKPKEPK